MNKFLIEDHNTYLAETFNERVCYKLPKPKYKKIAPVSVHFTPEERVLLQNMQASNH